MLEFCGNASFLWQTHALGGIYKRATLANSAKRALVCLRKRAFSQNSYIAFTLDIHSELGFPPRVSPNPKSGFLEHFQKPETRVFIGLNPGFWKTTKKLYFDITFRKSDDL